MPKYEAFDDLAVRFREAIFELETARRNKTLFDVIQRPEIVGALGSYVLVQYKQSAYRPVYPEERLRDGLILRSLSQFEEVIRTPRHYFRVQTILRKKTRYTALFEEWASEASLAPHDINPSISTDEIHAVEILHDGLTYRLHRPQFSTCTRWGHGFIADSHEDTQSIIDTIVISAVASFAVDLGAMSDRAIATKRWAGRFSMNAGVIESYAFEKLIIDVLNAQGASAKPAPLQEDIFEDTDAMVRIFGLERKRGQRIQISLACRSELVEKKICHMKRPDEIILVSPYSLAEAAKNAFTEPEWADFDWTSFWDCFRSKPASVDEMAIAFRSMFMDALRTHSFHPLGAAGALPLLFSEFIARYVFCNAVRCDRAMKSRVHGKRP